MESSDSSDSSSDDDDLDLEGGNGNGVEMPVIAGSEGLEQGIRNIKKVNLAQRALNQRRASAASIKINVTGTIDVKLTVLLTFIRFACRILSWHPALRARCRDKAKRASRT